jgi:hypothetical protein
MADKVVFWVTTVTTISLFLFLAGYEAGQEKSAAALAPCPVHAGFTQTTSTWSRAEGLKCFYQPNLPNAKGQGRRT